MRNRLPFGIDAMAHANDLTLKVARLENGQFAMEFKLEGCIWPTDGDDETIDADGVELAERLLTSFTNPIRKG